MSAPVVIGTRGSPLALAQSGQIRDLLAARHPSREFVLRVIKTGGDAWASSADPTPLPGKGIFTREIEEALLAGEIALAVHSLKDLPVAADDPAAPGLTLGAIPERADARDLLVVRAGVTLAAIPGNALIATGSGRRASQLRARWPHAQAVPIRGNIDTRLRKFRDTPAWHGLVLAAAGVARLGPALDGLTSLPLPFDLMLPAPGQGALALQCRAGDSETLALLAAVDHAPTRAAVAAERAFLEGLGGGCLSPVGAYAAEENGSLRLRGIAWIGDSPDPVFGEVTGPVNEPLALGQRLAKELKST